MAASVPAASNITYSDKQKGFMLLALQQVRSPRPRRCPELTLSGLTIDSASAGTASVGAFGGASRVSLHQKFAAASQNARYTDGRGCVGVSWCGMGRWWQQAATEQMRAATYASIMQLPAMGWADAA